MSDNTAMAINDIERAAGFVVKSRLFGGAIKTSEAAVALMLLAQSEGLHPMRAFMEYHIIDGRPSLRADTMLARFQNAGGRVEWHKYDESGASATFSHPAGGSVTVDWDEKTAKLAGLLPAKLGSGWHKYPRAMYRSRVISEGIRTVYPGVMLNLYTPDEVEHFAPAPKAVTESLTKPRLGRPMEASTTEKLPPPVDAPLPKLVEPPAPAEDAPEPVKQATRPTMAELMGELSEALNSLGLSKAAGKSDIAMQLASGHFDREIGSAKDLTRDELVRMIEHALDIRMALDALPGGALPPVDSASLVAWILRYGLPVSTDAEVLEKIRSDWDDGVAPAGAQDGCETSEQEQRLHLEPNTVDRG